MPSRPLDEVLTDVCSLIDLVRLNGAKRNNYDCHSLQLRSRALGLPDGPTNTPGRLHLRERARVVLSAIEDKFRLVDLYVGVAGRGYEHVRDLRCRIRNCDRA